MVSWYADNQTYLILDPCSLLAHSPSGNPVYGRQWQLSAWQTMMLLILFINDYCSLVVHRKKLYSISFNSMQKKLQGVMRSQTKVD